MSGAVAAMLAGGFQELVLDISNKASPNIPSLLASAGWLGAAQPVRLVNTALVNTLVIPSSLAGAQIYLLNSPGARIGGVKNSGTALRTQVPISIENQGVISGGGGQGSDGGGARVIFTDPPWVYASANAYGGVGGDGQGFAGAGNLVIVNAANGQPGQSQFLRAHGKTGDSGSEPSATAIGGTGGSGGAWGSQGGGGTNGSYSGSPSQGIAFPSTDAIPPEGYCIDGNSLVTWIATGTRLGRIK